MKPSKNNKLLMSTRSSIWQLDCSFVRSFVRSFLPSRMSKTKRIPSLLIRQRAALGSIWSGTCVSVIPVWGRRRCYVTSKQWQWQRELRINESLVEVCLFHDMPSPSPTKLDYWDMMRVYVILKNTIRLEY